MRFLSVFLILCCAAIAQQSRPKETDITASGDIFNIVCSDVGASNWEKMSDFSKGECLGYINGLREGAEASEAVLTGKQTLFCVPAEVSYNQTLLVIRNYIDAHPQQDQYGTALEAILALQKAFPCARH